MKIANLVELADDQLQGKVIIKPQVLKRIETIVNPGIPEDKVSPIAHHFIIGGLAYLASAPISDMQLKEVQTLYKTHANIFKMLAKALTKVTEPSNDLP